jgi:hypothetical protein
MYSLLIMIIPNTGHAKLVHSGLLRCVENEQMFFKIIPSELEDLEPVKVRLEVTTNLCNISALGGQVNQM